jgi:hypothetical protein
MKLAIPKTTDPDHAGERKSLGLPLLALLAGHEIMQGIVPGSKGLLARNERPLYCSTA